jgi:DNA topoisomerase-3
VLVNPGWLAVYGKEAQDDDANLVPVAPGEVVRTESVDVKALQTKPPARYTEATLLSAMEGAGKLIDDDELREAMAEKGLGTPATRAAIIEGLILEKYMLREGRELVPTAKAFQLMTLLRGLGVEDLTKPELTGNWEHQLAEMEQGRLEREAFMAEIAAMAERIVRKAKEYDRDTIPGDYATLAVPCPNCGGVVKENYRRFACAGKGPGSGPSGAAGAEEGCGFSITKIPAGRAFELAEADAASSRDKQDRAAGGLPLQGRLAVHRRAQARLRRRDQELEARVRLRRGRQGRGRRRAGGLLGAGAWAPAPSARAMCTNTAPATSASTRWARITCDFKSGKIILQQPVAREQMSKLLATGKTDLLENFVSNKTRRKFKAFLAFDKKEGKVIFEFEPRAAKAPAKKAAAKKTAAERVNRRGGARMTARRLPQAAGDLPDRRPGLGGRAAALAGRPATTRGADPARLLGNAAFYIFVPALLFRTTARLDLAAMPWGTVRPSSCRRAHAPARRLPVAARARRRSGTVRRRPAVRAISASFGNSVQVGIPFAPRAVRRGRGWRSTSRWSACTR